MREKLIELICDAKRDDPETGSFTEFLADHLLANGVIVLPCKVGDTVWDICEFLGKEIHPEMYIMQSDEMIVCEGGWFVYDDVSMRHEDFGRIFFTSREEAEAALRK